MEKKEFRFIKNILWPFPTTISVGPEGIAEKGKLVRWEDIKDFNYGVTEINGAMNYQIAYDEKNGKGHILNFIVSLLGSKKKKAMMRELYVMVHEGFTKHHVEPKAEEYLARIEAGETVTLAGCEVSKQGLKIQKGILKKEYFDVAAEDVRIVSRGGSGGFDISSVKDDKNAMYVPFQGGSESRYLLAVLNRLYPDRALDIY